MGEGAERPTVLHGKFSSWLPWHQPFLDDLLRGLDADFRNVVLCNRVENEARFGRPDVIARKTRALLQPAAAALCAADLRARAAPELLHAHFGWSAMRLLLLKRMLDVPMVVTFGGRDAGVQLGDPRTAPLYEVVLAAADRIVCVSGDLAERVRAAGADPARVEVVHRGVDLAFFAPVARQRAPGAPLALLAVGRLVAKKGHADAIAALARLRARGVDASLTVVGEGSERRSLEALAAREGLASHVSLVGATDRAGVRAHLARADVLVHASVTPEDGDVEGIPNVAVEAAATGLPIVATRHGGLVDVVEEGATGWLVPERDPEALVEALRRLAQRPAQRLALGAAAAARAREHFDLRRQVARHVELYHALRGGKPRPVPLPEDWDARVRAAAGVGGRPWDHALARAAAVAAGLPDPALLLRSAPRGALDRLLEAPTAWPRPWRSAAELALDLAGRSPLRGPLDAFRRRSRERSRALDLHVLEFLRAGGSLAPVPEALARLPLRDLAGEAVGASSGWRRLRRRLAEGPDAEPDG